MVFWVRAMLAGVALALVCAPTALAGLPVVVSSEQEADAANPGRHARRHPEEGRQPAAGDFHATMDRVFGEGRWRQTSGYRTRAEEDRLRRQGAGTVPRGAVSKHSVGDPVAPAAYDAVVAGVPAHVAAAKLKQSGAGFAKVLAEGRHGAQGAHLHIELISAEGPSGGR